MSLASTQTRFDRRTLLRGTIAVAAASTFPLRRSYAGEALNSAGEKVMLSDTLIADLQKSIKGTVILPSNPEYEMARRVWSRGRRPPAGVDREMHLGRRYPGDGTVCPRQQYSHRCASCGGHNYDGDAMVDKGLVIDLGPFNNVGSGQDQEDRVRRRRIAAAGQS